VLTDTIAAHINDAARLGVYAMVLLRTDIERHDSQSHDPQSEDGLTGDMVGISGCAFRIRFLAKTRFFIRW